MSQFEDERRNISDKKTEKRKPFTYIVGYIIGTVLALCMLSIAVALTINLVRWIL